jgi:hypothetical protein
MQICKSCAFVCAPFEGFTDPMTRVSEARGERGGWISRFSGSGVHQCVTHGVTKPRAKMVGVAHSIADPFLGVVVNSKLALH